MKEVKFRVWCKDSKEWEKDNCLLTENGELLHQIRHGSYMLLRPENHVVSFYTGLKDKNGKEIYEGDIVRCWGGEFCQGYWECDTNIVINDMINDCFIVGENEFSEVLGNIYENPELLEGLK